MDIFSIEAMKRIKSDNIFMRLSNLISWERVREILKPTRHELGSEGYDELKLFRALLLGQWHSLSDRDLEDVLRIRIDFMLFCDFSSYESVPDHSTLCRFRNTMVKLGLLEKVLKDINEQLEDLGLKVKKAEHAVIDATLIASAARPNKETTIIAEDRKEEEVNKTFQVRETLSKDGDASWLKKGSRYHFGYKAFARVDGEGYFEQCKFRPANEAESPHFISMVKGATANRILTDKGNVSQENRDALNNLGFKDGIMYKATRAKSLTKWQKRFNKLVSKNRYVVEQSFGTLKRKFQFSRSRYMGMIKSEAQMIFKAICVNLLKGGNKITLKFAG